MQVNIQSIHFKADRKLTHYIRTKCEKLGHFSAAVMDTQVYLRLDKNPNEGNKVVELKLHVPQHTVYCTERARTFEEATDHALEAAARQLKRYSQKRTTQMNGGTLVSV